MAVRLIWANWPLSGSDNPKKSFSSPKPTPSSATKIKLAAKKTGRGK